MIALANLRGVGVRPSVRAPDLPLHRDDDAARRVGLIRFATATRHSRSTQALDHFTGASDARRRLVLPAAASVLVRRGRAERRRAISNGDPGVPQAGVAERRHHADVGGDVLGRCSSASPCSPITAPTLSPDQTILSTMGHAVFGDGLLYILLQASTAVILTLSANTAFADFPRLSGIVARRVPSPPAREPGRPARALERDPRLAVAAGVLSSASGATSAHSSRFRRRRCSSVHALAGRDGHAPLATTRRRMATWLPDQRSRYGRDELVTEVIVVSKFTEGAWIPTIVIPLLVLVFEWIQRHYQTVDRSLECRPGYEDPRDPYTPSSSSSATMSISASSRRSRTRSPCGPLPSHGLVSARRRTPKRCVPNGSASRSTCCGMCWKSQYREITRPVLEYVEELDKRWEQRRRHASSSRSSSSAAGGSSSCTTRPPPGSRPGCCSERAPS